MATENIKSAAITNSDATPPVANTIGQGAPGNLRSIDGSCAVTSGVTAAGATTYQLCRIPSNAKVKSVKLWLDAASTTITGDVGLYYSTDHDGGAEHPAVAGLPVVIDADFFSSAVALAAIIEPTEVSGESGTFVGAKRLKRLWDAVGLTVDPGGYFDLVFTLTSTAGAAAVVNGQVDYIE